MRTIIAGCRTAVNNYDDLLVAIDTIGWEITEVVSGCAEGGDALGERWAEENAIPLTKLPADWGRYGRGAGVRRNEAMKRSADALIALWDGRSSGTGHMIQISLEADLRVYIQRID